MNRYLGFGTGGGERTRNNRYRNASSFFIIYFSRINFCSTILKMNELKTMTHLCYVYIETYKKLHQVGIVIDPHYQYNLNIQERCLTIEEKPSIPNHFWGEGVYSLSAIVGGNGVGKSTVLRFILDAVVEGAANQDLKGCIVFEKDGNLYKCTHNCELDIIGISNVKIIETDNECINTFFYSGHFSPLFDYNDVRTVELTGMYNATDNFRLIKDLQDYSNVDTMHLSNNIQSHLFAYQAQNNYRICYLLSQQHIRECLDDLNFPKYIIISANTSGFKAIEVNYAGKFNGCQIPNFKRIRNSIKDNILANLIYYNLINTIADQDFIKIEAYDFLVKWCKAYNEDTRDILNFYREYVANEQMNETLRTFLNDIHWCLKIVDEICSFDDNIGYYIDVRNEDGSLYGLVEHLLSNRIYLTAKFFDMSYSHSLHDITVLSSGEQELLNLLSRLYYAVVIGPNKFDNLRSPSLLLLDEAEIGFHPEWQRQYVNQLCKFIQLLLVPAGHNFQIILTSHSPIILSDIPKCCTNFLKEENGYVVNNRDEQAETFAENIFNLYRRSFFMENGLIGEFASNKTDALKARIEQCHSRLGMETIRKEIDYIGDMFIKGYLLKKLDGIADRFSYEEQIAYYQAKIEELRRHKDE